jgi:hypothetical protein
VHHVPPSCSLRSSRPFYHSPSKSYFSTSRHLGFLHLCPQTSPSVGISPAQYMPLSESSVTVTDRACQLGGTISHANSSSSLITENSRPVMVSPLGTQSKKRFEMLNLVEIVVGRYATGLVSSILSHLPFHITFCFFLIRTYDFLL